MGRNSVSISNQEFDLEPNPNQAHQSFVVSSTSLPFTDQITMHEDTERVRLYVETDSIRFTVNGTTPTASLGIEVFDGGYILAGKPTFNAMKLIRVTADATIQVAAYL